MNDDTPREFSKNIFLLTHPDNKHHLFVGVSEDRCPFVGTYGDSGGPRPLTPFETFLFEHETPGAMAEARAGVAEIQKQLSDDPKGASCIPIF